MPRIRPSGVPGTRVRAKDRILIAAAAQIAALPLAIRGFGHVKAEKARAALAERDRLLEAFLAPPQPLQEAAE